MTTSAETHEQADTEGVEVLRAALQTFGWLGEPCEVREAGREVPGGVVAAVAALRSRRVEVVVDENPTEEVWESLRHWRAPDTWQLCALVPHRALGTAHEELGGCGLELQPWWIGPDRVSFGSVEIA